MLKTCSKIYDKYIKIIFNITGNIEFQSDIKFACLQFQNLDIKTQDCASIVIRSQHRESTASCEDIFEFLEYGRRA